MREIALDDKGTPRFKKNAVVRYLVNTEIISLNEVLAFSLANGLPIEDVEEFWQMLGYSTAGYGDLSFVRDETKNAADEAANRLLHPYDHMLGGMNDPLGR